MMQASSFPTGWRDQPPQVDEHSQGQILAWAARGGPFSRPVLAQSLVTVGISLPDRTIIRRVRVELLSDGFGREVDATAYPWFPALQWRGPVAIPGAGDHMEDVLAMVQFCRKCGGEMRPGQAIAQTFTGAADFPGSDVVTLSAGGPGKLIDCMKCSRCGHSVSGIVDGHSHAAAVTEESSATQCSECGQRGWHKMSCGQRTDKALRLPATRDAGGVVTVCQQPCRCGPDGCSDRLSCLRMSP